MGAIRNSLKVRLMVLISCILLIPCIAIGIFSYQSAKNGVREQMMKSATENVQILNDSIAEYVKAKEQDIEILAQQLDDSTITSIDGTNKGESDTARKQMDIYKNAHPEVELVYIGMDTGLYMSAPANMKNPPNYDPRTRPWYQIAMQNKGKVIITNPYLSNGTGTMVVAIAKVTKDGHGVAAILVNLNTIHDVTKKVRIGTNGYIYILDKDSNMIVHQTFKPGEPIQADWAKATFGSKSGTYSYILNGQPKEEVFTTNPLTGWKIAGTMYTSEFADASKVILKNTVMVVVLFMLLAIILVYLVSNSISKAMNQIMHVADQVSVGNLTEIAQVKRKDEIGKLAYRFNHMIESIRSVLMQVDETAEQLVFSSEELSASAEQTSRASEQISTIMQELAAGSDQQDSKSNEGSIIIRDMHLEVAHIAENAKNATTSAVHASKVTESGSQAIQTVNHQIVTIDEKVRETAAIVKTLGEYTRYIDNIVEIITNIASQTNLLALNAAIESARAGEHGRGFAVVADEVRKLAEQSAQSAGQIGEFIAKIRSETTNAIQAMDESILAVMGGMQVANEAESSFANIQEAIENVTSQVQEITEAVQIITASTEEVVHKIVFISELAENHASRVQTVSAATEEQLASMEEISGSSSRLSKMADDLKILTGKFKM